MDWTRRGIDNPLRAFLVDTELLLSLYFFDRKANPLRKAAYGTAASGEDRIRIAIEV